jgi:CheY-like chemotaxis protein
MVHSATLFGIDEEASVGMASRSLPEVESPKGLVLVVDDDDLLRETVALILERRGFVTEPCADAVQALSRLRAGLKPDLIVLDLMMPGIDGWEFRLIQKEHRQWMEIPVIAVSGDRSAKAAAIDADAFLVKPLCERDLLQTVERLVELSRRRRSSDRQGEMEHLRDLGSLASSMAGQIAAPITSLADSLKLAQRKTVELEKRLGSAEAFSMVGIRQLLQTAERRAERIHATLQGISAFSEMLLHAIPRKRRVLIAHSDRRLSSLVREALGEDYEVLVVSSGKEAQHVLRDDGFDAFLCELRLPDMHGIDLYERLSLTRPEQACRTVFLTTDNCSDHERAFFVRHRPWQLRAPFDAADLRELIESQRPALH